MQSLEQGEAMGMEHDGARRVRTSRWTRWAGWAVAAWALAGLPAACGGGVYVGDVYETDQPPEVNLASSTDTAAPNEVIRLVAAATDDFAVDRVSFYRVDGNTSVLLATDRQSPWQLDTVIPANAWGTVRYFARAVDDSGQSRDSELVSVWVP